MPPPSWPPAACLRFFRAAIPVPACGCIPAQPAHLAAGKGFSRPVWYLDSLWFMPPYNPPKHSILHRKSPRKIVQKNFPNSPVGGEWGNGFWPIDGPKKARYHPGQAEAARPPPSEPPQAARPRRPGRGEVNMATPSAGELLVQQAQEAERLRLLLLANECKDLDEFRQRLRDLLNK